MLNLAPDASAWYALLDFHVAAGVDCALEDEAQDRFAAVASEMQAFAEQNPASGATRRIVAGFEGRSEAAPPPRMAAATAPEQAAAMARDLARSAGTLEELHKLLSAFEGCPLRFSAKNLVFSDGNPQARIMLVGEAPGAEEDRIGKPFVGRSGQLLDRMLKAIGLDRESVYIANVVPWRPPGNRTPMPQEVAVCKPFIMRQIELVNPDFLICLGGPATQNLLDVKDGILRTRGRWFPYAMPDRSIQALATLHPAYLLRQPLQKRLAWRDFQALEQAIMKTKSQTPS